MGCTSVPLTVSRRQVVHSFPFSPPHRHRFATNRLSSGWMLEHGGGGGRRRVGGRGVKFGKFEQFWAFGAK